MDVFANAAFDDVCSLEFDVGGVGGEAPVDGIGKHRHMEERGWDRAVVRLHGYVVPHGHPVQTVVGDR